MPTPKKAATAEAEPKGEEQEPTTDPDEASPPEGEAQEQRGDGTPDPLEGFTAEQLRGHPLFEEASADLTAAQEEERKKAYREGQSAGAKQADDDARQWAAQEKAIKTFEDLETKRISGEAGDPDAGAEYARAMGDPKAREAYERGRSAKQGPGAQEIADRAEMAAMNAVFQPLKQHPLLKDMTEEEHEAVFESFRGKPQPFTQLVKRYCELVAEKGAAAGVIKENAQKLLDATEQGRREAYDEMGLQYPAERIEGTKPAKPGTADEYRQQHIDGDINTEEFTRKMEAIGAKP